MTTTEKTCVCCGRRIEWRATWERDWEQVRYCSAACRRRGVNAEDRQLEQAVLALLVDRAATATVCPSEVARTVGTEESWRSLMEPARRAARRLSRLAGWRSPRAVGWSIRPPPRDRFAFAGSGSQPDGAYGGTPDV